MKKLLYTICLILLIFSTQNVVNAETILRQNFEESLSKTTSGTGHDYDLSENINPFETIGNIIEILLGLVGIVFMGLIIYGGFKWMKASGREQDIEAAKKIIRAAMIGLIIVLASYAITAYIGNVLFETVSI